MMPRQPPMLLLLAAAALAACSPPRYVNVPMGRAGELGVRVERDGSASYLVLDRPACVAFLSVEVTYQGTYDWNRPDYGPVLGPFEARYPLYSDVPRCFEAGRHRFPLHRVVTSRIPRPTCLRGDVPSMEGCHPPGYQYASSHHDPSRRLDPGTARIILASDVPIDPFAVAYAMSDAILADPDLQEELARAILESDYAATARVVEGLVADVPGSPLWAGTVRMRDAGR